MPAPPALDRVVRRLAAGDRRVLVWGPPGVGRSTLLRRLRDEHGCEVVDAPSREEAVAALAAPGDDARVVAWIDRGGLSADAFVECARPPLEACTGWLDEALARHGVAPLDAPVAAALARAAERLPAALVRVPALLGVLSPAALLDRCARADCAWQRPDGPPHPLLTAAWPEAIVVAPPERELLARLAAAEGAAPDDLDGDVEGPTRSRRSPRCASASWRSEADGGRWRVPFAVRRHLAADDDFARAFEQALRREDERCATRAQALLLRWRRRGDPAALDDADRMREALRAAIARRSEGCDDAGFVACVQALALVTELRDGLPRAAELLDDAMTRCAPRSAAWSTLAVDRARAHGLRGEPAAAATLLDAASDAPMAPVAAAAWSVERAFQRRVDAPAEALALLERAIATYDALGLAHGRVQAMCALGALAYWRMELDDAVAHYDRARAAAAAIGARRAEALALTNACLCHTLRGDGGAATAAGAAAMAHFRALGDVGAEGTTLGRLGLLALQYGHLDQAECRLAEAEALLERAGYVEQWRYARFNRADVDLERGRLEDATRGLDQVEARLAVHPDAYTAVHVAALRADVHEAAGRLAEALAALDRGLLAGASLPHELAAVVAPRRVRLLARRGERAASAEAARGAEASLSLVRTPELRVAAELALGHAAFARGERSDGGAPPRLDPLARALAPAWGDLSARAGESVAASLPVRRAARLYWEALPAADRVAVEWRARDPSGAAVCVDPEGGLARLPGGATLTRTARRNAFHLVARLAEAWPRALAKAELIASLWPGERMQPVAAANRLNNAVAQLRALGGGALVERDADRYRLPAALPVVVAGKVDPLLR
ncbi:MAG: hypothetical protein U0324_03785 [Polyangiales bacterium]